MKKVLIFLAIVAVLSGALYFFWPFFKSLFGGSRDVIQPVPQLALEETDNIKILVNRPVFDYWFKGDETYYLTMDGEIFRISVEGTHRRLDAPQIANSDSINSFASSFDGKMVLMTFGDEGGLALLVFDIETTSWLPIDDNVVGAAWHPSQNQIAYLKSDANLLSLNPLSLKVINLTNQKTTEVIKLNIEDVILEWKKADEIYLAPKSSALSSGSVWALNISKKTLRPVINDGLGLMVNWVSDGTHALKFTRRDGKNNLDFIDSNNVLIAPVALPITIPTKCVFDKAIVYCAIPKNIPGTAILPDDYFKFNLYLEDDFWSWNTETGEVKTIYAPADKIIDAEKISKKNNALFFINRYDKNLYSLPI